MICAVVLFTDSSDLLIVLILVLLSGTSSSCSKSAHLLLRIKMNCLNALNVFSALALFLIDKILYFLGVFVGFGILLNV